MYVYMYIDIYIYIYTYVYVQQFVPSGTLLAVVSRGRGDVEHNGNFTIWEFKWRHRETCLHSPLRTCKPRAYIVASPLLSIPPSPTEN